MKRWMLTAFEPFAGAQTNSSWMILKALQQMSPQSEEIVFRGPVPVTFAGAWSYVKQELDKDENLDGILCLGQAESRSKISLERVALNCIDARLADNDQATPALGPIAPHGPDLYWSSIPWERLAPFPSWERSYSAGTYVCNTLMYKTLSWAVEKNKMAGFVHIPVLSTQHDSVFEDCPKMDATEALTAMQNILSFLKSL